MLPEISRKKIVYGKHRKEKLINVLSKICIHLLCKNQLLRIISNFFFGIAVHLLFKFVLTTLNQLLDISKWYQLHSELWRMLI